MTILFGGGEMGAFIPSDSTVAESATTTYCDAAFARTAIVIPLPSSYAQSATFASTTSGWLHFDHILAATSSDGAYRVAFELLTSGGDARIRLSTLKEGPTVKLEYWNGTTWVQAGSIITVAVASLQTIDVNWTVNSASGSVVVYFAGTERITSGTIDLSGVSNIASVKFYGRSGGATERFVSQVVTASESTIGFKLTTAPPTGAGATTDWTGGYTEIDERVYSDADFINSATNGQVELFAHGTTVPTGYRIKAVIVTARAKRGSAGPANLQLALRSSGTTYFTSSQAVSLGYGAHVGVWETDPATSAAFTASAIANLQFGVKAIT